MRSMRWLWQVLVLGGMTLWAAGLVRGESAIDLAAGFREPPREARAEVYWDWLNGNFDLRQMTRELEDMKAKGIGGVQIFDISAGDFGGLKDSRAGVHDPDPIVPAGPAFMGPESVKAIGHAVREATRLGMRVGLITSSSWNAGGPWVPPEHAAMGLFHSLTELEGPKSADVVLPFPEFPKRAPTGPDGKPLYSREIAVMAVRSEGTQKVIDDPAAVVDLTGKMDASGRLTWDAPAGRWTVIRFVATNTGHQLHIPSPNSKGMVIDHFSVAATRMHFQYIIDRLLAELGPFKGTALKYLYLCSYEIQGSTWTPGFLDEFQKRRGYDMRPYLPVLAGWKVKNKEISERFQADFEKTQGDLLVDVFYKTAREMSNKYGLLLCAEAGGPGPPIHNTPIDALKAQGTVDIVRGEFWNKINVWVVKETACAAHIYGKRIVDMEAFTSGRNWLDGPSDLKPLADRALCEGTNHFTLHTFPHHPFDVGQPGWVYYAGEHMGPCRVWWPKAKPLFDYLARCSYLMQQGLFVGDVCYYYGDKPVNFVSPKNVDPSLGFGYDYDVTNAEVILTRMTVRDGRIVLPDGMSYELLVLPEGEDMNPEVLAKLEELVRDGATVVGPKPTKTLGLTDYPHRDEQVKALADRLWGPCDGKTVLEHAYGKGRVIWGRRLREILQARGVGPDFSFITGLNKMVGGMGMDYIHRRTEHADIYFVRNTGVPPLVECVFRVHGKTPELWRPDTGEIRKVPVYEAVDGGTRMTLRLDPHGSVFVVFRDKADDDHLVSVQVNEDERAKNELQKSGEADVVPDEKGNLKLLARIPGQYVLRTAKGKRVEVDVERVPPSHELTGPWQVRFPAGWGAPASKVFDKLISWTEDSEPGIKYFSGIATYEKEIELPADLVRTDHQLWLDLGRVRMVADVWLNDQHLGIVWKSPFRVDITQAARPGKNRLVVEVANDWANRLIGDARATDGKRYTKTNVTVSRPGAKGSEWSKTEPIESGLLGPVRVVTAKRVAVGE